MKKRLTEVAHDFLAERIKPGDRVVDATMGNGHDTLFLRQHVGDSGHVYAFDIQQIALEKTISRLEDQGFRTGYMLIKGNHAEMQRQLPDFTVGSIAAVVFNLGYLPGGDKQLSSSATTTIEALEQSLKVLKPGGFISLLAYLGHPEGHTEHQAIVKWLDRLPGEYKWNLLNPEYTQLSPRLYVIESRHPALNA